jgi:hypothetical protein
VGEILGEGVGSGALSTRKDVRVPKPEEGFSIVFWIIAGVSDVAGIGEMRDSAARTVKVKRDRRFIFLS